jgi:DtxR family transcriptional regulator, Mn-dependent transcriptional regulator
MQTFCGLTTDGMLDYLAAIYKLAQANDRVTTSALAEMMCVSPPAASSMLKRLQDSDFVERSAPDGITLTEQGRMAAMQLIRRHRLLEVFLVEVMGFTWDQVDVEAHRLEHSVSVAFEDRMDRLASFPARCPHGDLIPLKDGTMPHEELSPITALQPGQQGILQRVGNKEPSILRYLSQLKLVPGRQVRLVDLAPFNGPVTLELLNTANVETPNGTTQPNPTQILGSELADALFVQVLN